MLTSFLIIQGGRVLENIRCPNCGTVFQVSESYYESIRRQIRDKEYEKDIASKEKQFTAEKDAAVAEALRNVERSYAESASEKDRKIGEMEILLSKKESEIGSAVLAERMKAQEELSKLETRLAAADSALDLARKEAEIGRKEAAAAAEKSLAEKDAEILRLNGVLKASESESALRIHTEKEKYEGLADKIVFTGMIDEYYNYCYGELEYRSLRFETERLLEENYQGNAVVNYTEYEIPYTRIIEHKHFEFQCQNGTKNPVTIITREYPAAWKKGDEPYYPMNDEKNNTLYQKYQEKAVAEKRVIFGGRLGMYRYYDMHQVIAAALQTAQKELSPAAES